MISMSLRPLAAAAAMSAALAFAQAPGAPAPNFTLTDTAGKPVQLSDYRGKYVVLEWTNPDCPFVRNHYRTGNMQALQKNWTKDGVAWLTINSTNQSHREFKTPAMMTDWIKAQGGTPQAVLIDAQSAVARQYGIKTTPEMYVINPAGAVIYAGAIDDRPSTRADDPPAAHNYVQAALTQGRAGVAVAKASAPPYGCSLKY
jgi:peroxiredoxin